MAEAIEIYLSSDPDDRTKIDRSLELTNNALDLDEQNIGALTHKATLLFITKDIDGLLNTVDQLIMLRPEKPFYLGQKAFYLELKGDTLKAKEFYDQALNEYQQYLKKDTLDFNLLLEYVGILEVSGDTTLANRTFRKMESMNFDVSQKQILHRYKRQSASKEQLKKYWNGDIGYEQLEQK